MPNCKLPQCFLCGKIYRGNLEEGVIIRGYYICERCEEKIMKITVNDSYYYKVVDRFKETIWKDIVV
ncbi:MAG: Inhibitor of sigma-G Gin [Clostridia bacterium]|jgi:hypothetical protein|nr:Inhibitor of sigma-G Gin [Clostridia bacterium]